jgi:hypothetical protein
MTGSFPGPLASVGRELDRPGLGGKPLREMDVVLDLPIKRNAHPTNLVPSPMGDVVGRGSDRPAAPASAPLLTLSP